MSRPNPVPDGFRTVTPYLSLKDCGSALEWYRRAFGAEIVVAMPGPGGKGVAHAEMRIGDSMIMAAEEWPGTETSSPTTLRGTTVGIHLYVADCDAWFERAGKAGAKITMPLMNMFWGDRFGKLQDPYGHVWSIATHLEDVSGPEMARRAEEAFKNDCPG